MNLHLHTREHEKAAIIVPANGENSAHGVTGATTSIQSPVNSFVFALGPFDREIKNPLNSITWNKEYFMIYPMSALVLVTVLVGAILFRLRIKAVKTGQIRLSQLRLNQSADIPDKLAQATKNYSNLFEVPVLFYTAGCLAISLKYETMALIVVAWLFVICRSIHSWIHLTSNHVIYRMYAFMAGNICVIAIWVLLLLHHLQHS